MVVRAKVNSLEIPSHFPPFQWKEEICHNKLFCADQLTSL